MSYKGPIEDKSAVMTPPRTCQQLVSSIAELRATFTHDHSTIKSAIERLERDQKAALRENLVISRRGGPMEHLIAFADALNDAMVALGQARSIVGPQ